MHLLQQLLRLEAISLVMEATKEVFAFRLLLDLLLVLLNLHQLLLFFDLLVSVRDMKFQEAFNSVLLVKLKLFLSLQLIRTLDFVLLLG